jgi:mono/diheme cytochrome c family protein
MLRWGIIGMVSGIGALALWGQSAPGQPGPVARGQQVYAEQKCQSCHSIAGVGNPRYPLDGVGSRLSDDDIRKWIVTPREMNPRVIKRGFDKLPKGDLDALVAYMKTLTK